MPTTTIAGILSQELYVQCAARWLEAVENPDPATLRRAFETTALDPAGQPRRRRAVSFSVGQLVQLVSAVGATHLKASFVLVPEAGPGSTARFTLVLAAYNALAARVSSYYLAAAYELPAAEDELRVRADEPATLALGAVPAVLGREWTRAWRRAPPLLPTQFAGNYGYLRGYTFELGDFLAPLAGVQSTAAGHLVLHFGLHAYYRPDPAAGDSLAQVFGLLLQLREADKGPRDDGGGDPGFNMGTPCPPSC